MVLYSVRIPCTQINQKVYRVKVCETSGSRVEVRGQQDYCKASSFCDNLCVLSGCTNLCKAFLVHFKLKYISYTLNLCEPKNLR